MIYFCYFHATIRPLCSALFFLCVSLYVCVRVTHTLLFYFTLLLLLFLFVTIITCLFLLL